MATLQVETRDGIAWVWLNRPERLNALSPELLAELRTTFADFSRDDSLRAVILAGRGRAFCSGFDIQWMMTRTGETVRADRAELREIFATIEHCPVPVISAVQGAALGGGLILTMVSDIVLAGEQAQFGAPEVKIGIFASLGLLPRLERLVGLRAAKELTLTGDPINAQRALEIGLITHVIAGDNLYSEAQTLAERLAALPSPAVKVTKKAFTQHALPGYVDWETNSAVECWMSPERVTAMQAFLDRRKSPRI